MIHPKSAVFVASLVVLLGACSSTPVTPPVAPMRVATVSAPAHQTPAPAATTGATAPMSAVATISLPPYLDPKNSISTERSVFFDFDDYSIKGEYNALVERHGKFLASSPKVAIRIEGNSDERGGSEYNLALGQKRAEAVLRALKIYGVKDQQMEAVSWGKTKPRATGQDESAWAQNRRADLQYPAR